MEDQLFIQRRFRIIKDGLSLSDALIYPKEEYESLNESQISTLKTERFTAFKEHIENPPVIEEPTVEEQLEEIEVEKKQLEEKISKVKEKNIKLTEVEEEK